MFSHRYKPPPINLRFLATLLAIGGIIGLLGPFGSYMGMDTLRRIGHFVLCFSLIGLAIGLITRLVARQWFAGQIPFWAMALIDVVCAIPSGWLIYGSLALLSPKALASVSLTELTLQTLFLSLIVHGAVAYFRKKEQHKDTEAARIAGQPDPLQLKLPLAMRGQPILALSAEDHYVRVYTARQSALVLMRLADAMAYVKSEGLQVHRSHWVARHAMADLTKEGLVLTTGMTLPVSRNRRMALNQWTAQ